MTGAMVRGLGRLGDLGLVAPLVAVAMGWLLPPVGELGHALLVPSVILMFAMSVAIVEPGRLHWPEAWPVIGLAVCNMLLAPLLAHGLARALDVDQLGGWVILVAACPAAGAASLVAGLLGLRVRPMMLAQLLCFFALPLTAPLVAFMLDAVVVDPWILAWRVGAMVALPCLLGLALRQTLRGAHRTLAFRPMRGLGTLGLCGVGLALAHGLSAKLDADIPWTACRVGLALTSLVGGALGLTTGVISGRLGGECLGATFALGGAVRNVSLLWSATVGISSQAGEAVMMLCTFWTLLLPALLGLVKWQRDRWRARSRLQELPHGHGRRGFVTWGRHASQQLASERSGRPSDQMTLLLVEQPRINLRTVPLRWFEALPSGRGWSQ